MPGATIAALRNRAACGDELGTTAEARVRHRRGELRALRQERMESRFPRERGDGPNDLPERVKTVMVFPASAGMDRRSESWLRTA